MDLLRYSTVVRRMGITKSIERSGEIVRRKKKKNYKKGKNNWGSHDKKEENKTGRG